MEQKQVNVSMGYKQVHKIRPSKYLTVIIPCWQCLWKKTDFLNLSLLLKMNFHNLGGYLPFSMMFHNNPLLDGIYYKDFYIV